MHAQRAQRAQRAYPCILQRTWALTYLEWAGNGTIACGARIDNNQGESYTVIFDAAGPPMLGELAAKSFSYGNDIDLTYRLNEGEQVLAWASDETPSCVVRTPLSSPSIPTCSRPFEHRAACCPARQSAPGPRDHGRFGALGVPSARARHRLGPRVGGSLGARVLKPSRPD